MPKRTSPTPAQIRRTLLVHALSQEGAFEDHPWGETVVKAANRKVFVFLGSGNEFSMSAKLPASGGLALGLPFASPTGYGLGKSGWVTAKFAKGDAVPLSLLKSWIDESHSAVAGGVAAAPRAKRRKSR
jgi:predicted DNA-binding protein (MmcQ/YjbR family)